MFDNEVRIPIKEEEAIKWAKIGHEVDRFKFYWEYTHNKKFLQMYKNALKEQKTFTDFITQKYLKNENFKYFSIYLSNNTLKFIKDDLK